MSLTDTHAHLYHSDFSGDRRAMMDRNRQEGIGKIYMPNVDSASIDGMLAMEMDFPGQCYAMMGLHPCSVKEDFEKELTVAEGWLSKRTFAGIGEIGTDLYWDKTFWEQQQAAFLIQVGWAKKYGLPVIIHCRQSIDETIDLIAPLADGKLTGIFHCFTGSLDQARRIIDMGFFLGIGGVVTFKNGGVDKVLPSLGLDRVVLETDSPWLAPVPHRGKRNESSYLPIIARKVSDLCGVSFEEVQRITTDNAETIFGRNPG